MIIHLCLSCGKISVNRIAGDDNEYQLLLLLEESNLESKTIHNLINMEIKLLTLADKEAVLNNLFGS